MLSTIEPYKGVGETVSGTRTFDRLEIRERVIDTGARTLAIDEIASISVGADDHWPAKLVLLGLGVVAGVAAFVYPLLAVLSLVLIVSAVFVRATQTLSIVTSDGTKTLFSSAHRAELDEVHAFLSEKINTGDVAAIETFIFAPGTMKQPIAQPDEVSAVPPVAGSATAGSEAMTPPASPQQAPYSQPSVAPPTNSPSAQPSPPQATMQTVEAGSIMDAGVNTAQPDEDAVAYARAPHIVSPSQPSVNSARAPSGGGLLHRVIRPAPTTNDATPPKLPGYHYDYSAVLSQVTELNRFYVQTPDTQHIEERLSEMEVLMRSGTPNEEGRERIRVLSGELSTILQVYPTMVQLFDNISSLTQQRAA